MAVAAAARATAASCLVEFPISADTNAGPAGITTGPDGNLWFTERHNVNPTGNSIGRITPSGVITLFPIATTNGTPLGITTGPDGALWFAEDLADKIGRITTSGVITEFPLPAGAGPARITTGPDGNLWFTEVGASRIGRITTGGVVTEFPLPIPLSAPLFITTGPDGNLWFTEGNTDQIGRITTAGVLTEFPLPLNSLPRGITAGPDGNLWFTEFFSEKIGQMTTGGVLLHEFPVSGSEDIQIGPDGNLWFTDVSANKIGRITTSGEITGAQIPNQPLNLTTGPDGNLWFTEFRANQIGRLTVPLIACPGDITVSADAGLCSTVVNGIAPAAQLNCGAPSVTYTLSGATTGSGTNDASGTTFAGGVTTVTYTISDTNGLEISCSFTVTVKDTQPPVVACVPTVNPAGKTVPPAGTNPKSGQNPDGFYQLKASDNCGGTNLVIFVKDSAEGPCGGVFSAGPYAPDTRVKLTQSPGKARVDPMPGAIVAHIHTVGEPVLVVTDSSGNTTCHNCFVPPPPKIRTKLNSPASRADSYSGLASE